MSSLLRLADYSQEVTVPQLAAALHAGNFDGVWHYMCGSFAARIESPAVVSGIRALGWPQGAISVPTLSSVDGRADAARVMTVYGLRPGDLIALDIEPDEFRADPQAWARAADSWCRAVRAANLSPVVYGVDATLALCAGAAAFIWRAVPGLDDPDAARPQLSASIFPGRRAVQGSHLVAGGVSFDVSLSEFTLGGAVLQDLQAAVAHLQVVADEIRWAVAPSGADPAPDGSTGSSGSGELAVRLRDANAALAAISSQIGGLAASLGNPPAPADFAALRADVAEIRTRVDRALQGSS